MHAIQSRRQDYLKTGSRNTVANHVSLITPPLSGMGDMHRFRSHVRQHERKTENFALSGKLLDT